MEHIKSILNKRIRKQGFSSGVTAAQMLKAAHIIIDEIFPQAVASQIHPRKIQRGFITFRVTHPIYGQEVRMRETQILDAIKVKFPGSKLRAVRIDQF